MKKALILVDMQNDFLPGGSLPVPNGHEIIEIANRLAKHFELIVASKDWHPAEHLSFASNHKGKKPGDIVLLGKTEQVLWPDHCVQHTNGAEIPAQFDISKVTRIFLKGIDPHIDSYSTFFDNARERSTGLGEYLKEQGVDTVYIMGLATDYCVKYSVLDACQLGFTTYIVEDGCRGIDLQHGDVETAINEMKKVGAVVVKSEELQEKFRK